MTANTPSEMELNWDINDDHYLSEFKVFLPNWNEESAYTVTNAQGKQQSPVAIDDMHGGRLLSFKERFMKWVSLYAMEYAVSYRPSNSFTKPVEKRFTVSHALDAIL